MTSKQREKQIESLRKHWKTHKPPMTGKCHSEETKNKISTSQKIRAINNPKSFVRGKNHPYWKGGKTHNSGYILLLAKHPKADMNGRVREHIIVAEKTLGRYLIDGEVVHHINGKKDDNRPENLLVILNQSEHLKLHWRNKYAS